MIKAQVALRVEKASDEQCRAEQRVRGERVQEGLQAGLALGDELWSHVAEKALRGKREVCDSE